jgi:hypothetical protein
MADYSDVRYSQGDEDIGSARNFPWEHPVPKTPFWDDVPYNTACNVLVVLDANEPTAVDPNNINLDEKEKLRFLEKLLRNRLASKNFTAAPKTLYDIDYGYW